jgi:hypothetical protein
MEVALRRRLEGVASISISQQRQTAEVTFARGPHIFSPEEFRAAVGEADVEVLSFEIEACGRVEPGAVPGALGAQGAAGAPGTAGAPGAPGAARWFVAGPNRFLLKGVFPSGADTVCISGALDDGQGVVYIRHVE